MNQVAVGIIKNDKNEFLFVSSRKIFPEHTGDFYPPGGSIQENETPYDTVVRELWEELRAFVIPGECIAITPGDVPDQTTYWIECELVTKPENFQVNSAEIADVQWRTSENRHTLPLWPATEQFFQKHVDRASVSGEREQ